MTTPKFKLMDVVRVTHGGETFQAVIKARTLANPPFRYDVMDQERNIIGEVPEAAITLIRSEG